MSVNTSRGSLRSPCAELRLAPPRNATPHVDSFRATPLFAFVTGHLEIHVRVVSLLKKAKIKKIK